MQLNSLPRQHAFRLLICLLLVSAVYMCFVIIYQRDELETSLFTNQTFMKTAHVERQGTQHSSSKVVLDAAITDSSSQRVCYVSSEHKNVNPLDDFIKYPCLNGLPAFTDTKWAQPVKCVRTYCYPVLNNGTSKAGVQSIKSCVTLKTPRGKTPICIYPPQTDIHVSGSLQRGGQWEGSLVANLAKFIKAKPGTVFLDIGCNIGAYTVSMAHLGINVTAMDPMLENLELLSRSLVLGNLQNIVTLLWNAASNYRKLVKFKVGKRNIGGTRIVDVNASTAINERSYIASTIMLDDLIPLFRGKRVAIKIDIEESEYNALLGGSRFLNEIDVAVIQIEYLFHKKGKDGPKIFSYLASKGFSPYRDLGKRSSLKSTTMRSWPNDLYYMKP